MEKVKFVRGKVVVSYTWVIPDKVDVEGLRSAIGKLKRDNSIVFTINEDEMQLTAETEEVLGEDAINDDNYAASILLLSKIVQAFFYTSGGFDE